MWKLPFWHDWHIAELRRRWLQAVVDSSEQPVDTEQPYFLYSRISAEYFNLWYPFSQKSPVYQYSMTPVPDNINNYKDETLLARHLSNMPAMECYRRQRASLVWPHYTMCRRASNNNNNNNVTYDTYTRKSRTGDMCSHQVNSDGLHQLVARWVWR